MTYLGKEKDARETFVAYSHLGGGKCGEIKPRVVVKPDRATALIDAAKSLYEGLVKGHWWDGRQERKINKGVTKL